MKAALISLLQDEIGQRALPEDFLATVEQWYLPTARYIYQQQQEQPTGPDDALVQTVGFLGQADQNIRLDDLGVVNGGIGDNDVGPGCATPGGSPVALRLGGIETFHNNGGLGQNDGCGDDALSAGS